MSNLPETKMRLPRGFNIDIYKSTEDDSGNTSFYGFTFNLGGSKIYRNGIISNKKNGGDIGDSTVKIAAIESVGKFLVAYGNHLLRINRKLKKRNNE